MRLLIVACLGLISIGAAACLMTDPPSTLPPIPSDMDEIHVVANVGCTQPKLGTGNLCSSITDREQIERIVTFVNSRPNSWSTPWAGAPIHPVSVEFRKGGKHQQTFGISSSSFERATFLSRPASHAEVDEALELVGLTRPNLRFDEDEPIPE